MCVGGSVKNTNFQKTYTNSRKVVIMKRVLMTETDTATGYTIDGDNNEFGTGVWYLLRKRCKQKSMKRDRE